MKTIYMRPISALLMATSYLVSEFIDYPHSDAMISFFTLATILSFIRYLGRTALILISSLLFLSVILFLNGNGLTGFFFGLSKNVGLLTLFIFVPLISIPIKNGKYLDYMDAIFNHYIQSSRQLYIYLKGSMMGIGSVMNLGTIPILYQLTNTPSFESLTDTRLRALIRGFAMSFLWSPYFISVALIISYFNVTWVEIFPIGFGLAALGIILGIVMMGKSNAPIETVKSETRFPLKTARRKLLELLTIIIVMTIITMLVEHNVELSVITIIPLIAIVFSTIWTLFFLSPKKLINEVYDYTQNRLPNMGNELSLFIAAGAFGVAILNAGASDWIIYFIEVLGIKHVLLLIPVLALLVNALSFVGVHPIITNTALAITLSSSPLFVGEHLILSVGLLVGWMMTILISPFSATNLMVGNLTNTNSVRVGLQMNWHYAIILYVLYYLVFVGLYFVL